MKEKPPKRKAYVWKDPSVTVELRQAYHPLVTESDLEKLSPESILNLRLDKEHKIDQAFNKLDPDLVSGEYKQGKQDGLKEVAYIQNPDTDRGRKHKQASQKYHAEQLPKTVEKHVSYCQAVKDFLQNNPNLSLHSACLKLENKTGIGYKTYERAYKKYLDSIS